MRADKTEGTPMTTQTARLDAGAVAPGFTLKDQDGASVSLSDFGGQKVILYFYPEAMTPGCVTQACDFRDSLNSLRAAGYQVIGVSPDEPKKLKKFQKVDKVNFPLLSDPDLVVHNAYGVWGDKVSFGRNIVGVIRSTFVIDEDGVITLPLYHVKATGHVAMLRRMLKID